MHLIAALSAGVAGAESGAAFLYQRGTSTLLASYYTDFEATASTPQTSTGIALDAHGGAVVYVDTLCLVVVKSSVGTTIRSFVAGAKDSAVEVISDSFTGVSYSDASTGVSRPTTLQSVLDRWNDSAGTSNFQVLVGGVATTLQTAVQGVSGFFYNVKASTYGATGDGTTDDTASVQAAIDAANTAGGGVVLFPAGTYRTTSMLTIPYTVSLLGAGAEVAHLKMDAAANPRALSFPGTSSTHYRWQSMAGLRVSSAQANSTPPFLVKDAYLRLSEVHVLGASSGFSGTLFTLGDTSTAYHVAMSACYFETQTRVVTTTAGTASTRLDMRDCTAIVNATTWTAALVSLAGTDATSKISVSGCVFDATAATVACTGIFVQVNAFGTVNGNQFLAPASNTSVGIDVAAVTGSGELVSEYGNLFSLVASAYGTGVTGYLDQAVLGSRSLRWLDTSSSTSPITLRPDQYGSELIQWGGAGLTVNASSITVPPIGHPYRLTVWNDTAGNITLTLGTQFKGTNPSVLANTLMTLDFISRAGPAGTVYLYQVGTPRSETE